VGTILVVDDNLPSRYTTSRVLSRAGFDVREAGTGTDALRLASVADLIVLDIALPDIDGFEVCTRLKQDARTRMIPVIHKTAVYRDADHRRRGLAVGADDYLVDPVEPSVLVHSVERVLRPMTRTGLTRAKMRRGGLPAPADHRRRMGIGDGTACDGCAETIEATDKMHSVRVRGVLDFRFHDSCYNAWATYMQTFMQ
jgi:CheY-like chemotaxis protein